MRHATLLAFFAVTLIARSVSADPADAEPSVALIRAHGDVKVRAPRTSAYVVAAEGGTVADGTRIRVGDGGEAVIRHADGSESTISGGSEIIVRATRSGDGQPNGVVLFFGRVLSEVVKLGGSETRFEVVSANAVAGVRGTKFEVGVADDGATRVIVREGVVAVGGDADHKPAPISAGFEIESNGEGRLSEKKPAPAEAAWPKWFAERAEAMRKNGTQYARHLDGRLEAKRAELDRLRESGANTEALERAMHASFGMFERWGALVERGGIEGAEEIARLVSRSAQAAERFEHERAARRAREHAPARERERERRRR